MNKKHTQRLKLQLNKKTIILLGANAEKYRTGNQQELSLLLFTAGAPRCVTVTTSKPSKESSDCSIDCTITG